MGEERNDDYQQPGSHREESLLSWLRSFPAAKAVSALDNVDGAIMLAVAEEVVNKKDQALDGERDPWQRTLSLVAAWSSDRAAGAPAMAAPGSRETVLWCLERLLGYAVGEHCNARATLIERIIALKAAVQAGLKIVIDEQMERRHRSGADGGGGTGDFGGISAGHANLPNDWLSPQRPTSTPSTPVVPTATALFRSSANDDGAEAENLRTRYSAALEREAVLERHVRRLSSHVDVMALREGIAAAEADSELEKAHAAEIDALRARLAAAQAEAASLRPLPATVAALKDEIDCLRPLEGRVAVLEEALGKARCRLEESGDVRQQLQRSEQAHAELLERSLVLETETQQIPGLRRHLDGYKRDKTALQFRVKELESENEQITQERDDSIRRVAELADAAADARAEIARLQDALRQAAGGSSASTAADHSSSLGTGVSELNPHLTEEMGRLRRERDALAAASDETTVARVASLEAEVDDARRLADACHAELVTTRNELACTTASLRTSEEANASALADAAAWRQRHAQALDDGAHELAASKRLAAALAAAAEARWRQRLHASQEASAAREQELYSSALLAAQRSEALLALRAAGAAAEVEEWREVAAAAAEDAAAEREALAAAATRQLEIQAAEAARNLRDLRDEFEEYRATHSLSDADWQAKAEQFARKLSAGRLELDRLEAENEDLMQARRRLEKEKTMLWGEADRFKRQAMQAGTGGGGVSLSEFDALSAEFRRLLEENAALRAAPQAGGSAGARGARGGGGGTSFGGGMSEDWGEAARQYESRLARMAAEKRELMLKFSTQVSSKNEQERLARQAESEAQRLGDELRRTRLAGERLERQLSSMREEMARLKRQPAVTAAPVASVRASVAPVSPLRTPKTLALRQHGEREGSSGDESAFASARGSDSPRRNSGGGPAKSEECKQS